MITTTSSKPIQREVAQPFDTELKDRLTRLRGSMVEVLSSVGANIRVPQSITRDFGVDKSLASKIARVIRESDPYSAALDVPGEEAMRIFSRSMRDAGAPQTSLKILHDAVQAFQEMVRRHCGDRATLEMVAANSANATSQKQRQQLENFRRNMFRGASAVYGVQARAHVAAHFLAPSTTNPEMVNLAIAGGLVGFRRIRSDVSWAMTTMRVIGKAGGRDSLTGIEPLDPNCLQFGDAPLLCDFCSKPVPQLTTIDLNKSLRKLMLPAGPVGTTHEITLFNGWLNLNVCSKWKSELDDDDESEHFMTLTTPVERVIHDLYVHRDLVYAMQPEVYLYNQLPGALAYPEGPKSAGLLQLPEKPTSLGSFPPQPATPDAPEYVGIVHFAFQRLGYRSDDFVGIRTQIAYPPIPAMLLYRYQMPEKKLNG